MEEIPVPPGEVPLEAPIATDPKGIGEALLRYEATKSEPLASLESAARNNIDKPVSPVETLLRPSSLEWQSQPEPLKSTAESPKQELREASFDRRREVVNSEMRATRMAEGMVAIGEVLKESPLPKPVVKSASWQTDLQTSSAPTKQTRLTPGYKKALTYGVATGLLIGLLLVFFYST